MSILKWAFIWTFKSVNLCRSNPALYFYSFQVIIIPETSSSDSHEQGIYDRGIAYCHNSYSIQNGISDEVISGRVYCYISFNSMKSYHYGNPKRYGVIHTIY